MGEHDTELLTLVADLAQRTKRFELAAAAHGRMCDDNFEDALPCLREARSWLKARDAEAAAKLEPFLTHYGRTLDVTARAELYVHLGQLHLTLGQADRALHGVLEKGPDYFNPFLDLLEGRA